MNYSEEEKKAIERLEEILKSFKTHKEQLTKDNIYFNQDEDFIIPFQTVLNLISKQQKEIENSVSKDKIREKIEELKQKAINFGLFISKDEAFKIDTEIDILKELLEVKR